MERQGTRKDTNCLFLKNRTVGNRFYEVFEMNRLFRVTACILRYVRRWLKDDVDPLTANEIEQAKEF